MYKPSSNSSQASLFLYLETMLDSKHTLLMLANMVDRPLFSADNSHYRKPIRLMTGGAAKTAVMDSLICFF